MKECVTHHHACDCREAALADEIAALKTENERMRKGLSVIRVVTDVSSARKLADRALLPARAADASDKGAGR